MIYHEAAAGRATDLAELPFEVGSLQMLGAFCQIKQNKIKNKSQAQACAKMLKGCSNQSTLSEQVLGDGKGT